MSTALEVVGLVLIAVAMALVAPWLGLAVAGIESIVAGVALSLKATAAATPADLSGDGA